MNTFNRIDNRGIIVNGDCLEFIKENIRDKSIDLICSDPPYMVNYKGGKYDDSEEAIKPLIPLWYREWYRVLKDDSFMFLFVGVKTLHTWIYEGIKAGFEYKNCIATRSFNNGAITPKNNFGFEFQPVLVFSKGKGRRFNQVDFIPTSIEWYKDKRNKNPKPYTYAYPNWIKTEWAFATEKRASKNFHPNEKNVALLKFLIEVSTNRYDLVLEPFMGSGSTCLACLKSERRFLGTELNEDYYKVCKNRIFEESEKADGN